jgi:glutamyl-tRNA synthetase
MSWTPDPDVLDFLELIALQNAVEYDGHAAVGSVIGRIMGIRDDLRAHGKSLAPAVAQSVAKANAFVKEQGLEAAENILRERSPDLLAPRQKAERREGLPELPQATKGKVVLRFAPNPNGPLSFGHARGIVINGQYAEDYDGELILRFDDTDTVVKPPLPEAYDRIVNEATWLLGRAPDRVVIASDRIPVYYEHAERLLEGKGGYVCTCSAEAFRDLRVAMTPCPCREIDTATNIERWHMMLDGRFAQGEAVVRVRTGMDLPNPALRDWPALRIQETTTAPHPRPEVGSKYRVWPLLDFQSAVEDHLQGVTHIIRGKDLMDSTRKQTLLYAHFGWTYPETMYWGRVKVHEWGGFSTSAMRSDIESGIYEGWDDPRLPTIAALRRRGIQPYALRAFWLELAITQKDIAVPLATLFSHNTSAVDADAHRLAFVRNPVPITLNDAPPAATLVAYPNEPERNPRRLNLSHGQVFVEAEDLTDHAPFRLKDLGDVEEQDGAYRISSLARSDARRIVHWTTLDAEIGVLVMAIDDHIVEVEGRLEPHALKPGAIVQLERIGYAILLDDGRLLLMHE